MTGSSNPDKNYQWMLMCSVLSVPETGAGPEDCEKAELQAGPDA